MKLSAGLFVMIILSSGCCFFLEPPPPPPENDAKVVVNSSSAVDIEDVWVHQEGASLVIEGILHPGSFVQKKTGHVDVRIVDADKNLLQELKIAPDEALFSKENGKLAPFSASVALVVSPDTKVYLTHHAGTSERCSRVKP